MCVSWTDMLRTPEWVIERDLEIMGLVAFYKAKQQRKSE